MVLMGLVAPVSAQTMYPANGHYYQIVTVSGGTDWFNAKTLAESMTFQGVSGHLATITSDGEGAFIKSLEQAGLSYWAGGFKPTPDPDSAAGWQWVTGEPWAYTSWDDFEPNGGLSGEDGIEWRSWSGKWNDRHRTTAHMPGYIVEFPTVPEPSGVLVLLSGTVGLIRIMRRTK